MKIEALYWTKLNNLLARIEVAAKVLHNIQDKKDIEEFETRIYILERALADEVDGFMIAKLQNQFYKKDKIAS